MDHERARRLPPDARRRQLLQAARRCLVQGGLGAFSMECLAREAGVAGALPRHYFGSLDGLLTALTEQTLQEIQAIFLPTEPGDLAQRLDLYLDWTQANPWAHGLWLHIGETHAGPGHVIAQVRQRLAGTALGTDWDLMGPAERFAAIGWIGFIESAIALWIAEEFHERDILLALLVRTAQRLAAHQPSTRRDTNVA